MGGALWRENGIDSAAFSDNTRSMVIDTRDIYPEWPESSVNLTGLILAGTQHGTGAGDASLSGYIDTVELHGNQARNALASVSFTSVANCDINEMGTMANARGFRHSITLTDTGMNELVSLTHELSSFSPAGLNA